MDRSPGLSVRLKLTLSYAGFLMVAGVLLIAGVWVFLVGDLPEVTSSPDGILVFRSIFLHTYLPAAVGTLVSLLVFGLLGGWFLAGRMLVPLTRITEAARLASAGSLSHRIRLPGRGDEFRELADAFDTMLARLEAHVDEQRRFAANASHELRTPLATSKALLDVAREDPDHDGGELVERLHAVNARAIELTEALLVLGRVGQRAFGRERVDLSLVAEEAAETLLPLAEGRGVVLEAEGEVAAVAGSPSLLLLMTTNLVQNAIVHNLPEGGEVRVGVGVRAGAVVLTVENTGERIAPEVVPTLTEPFRRGTERVHTDHAGAGLGLAIVESVARAHDGTLTLAPRAGGGMRATVGLPAAPPDTGG